MGGLLRGLGRVPCPLVFLVVGPCVGARAGAWGTRGLRASAFSRAPVVRGMARVSFLDVTPPRTGARGRGLSPLRRGFGSDLGVGLPFRVGQTA